MISRAYVFVDGIEAEPIICGIIELNTTTHIGKFRYGQSYLQREDAFALDPLHLPLLNDQFVTRINKGMFGAILDAGADSWGKKLLLSLHQTKPKNALEFVLAGSGMGVGALTFSLSRMASKRKKNPNTLGDIALLLQGKKAILNNHAIPAAAKKAFEFGTSMGGARPKTLIDDNGISYIAKFNRPDDIINVCAVEHATMSMLKALHLNVANTRILKQEKEDILLVERFDCLNGRPAQHFLSAHSLINQSTINDHTLTQSYSYGAIAEFIMKYGTDPTDAHEIFKRMVFNILMGNTDDHARNHAFLYDLTQRTWRLSPAYDVLPINNSQQHGIGIGTQGRMGNLENALSQASRFGLTPPKAKKFIADIQEVTSQWQPFFTSMGISEPDIERLKGIIPT